MRTIIGLLALLPTILTGCAVTRSAGIDAIRPPALKEPVFVVVPPNQSGVEDSYATEVERTLLNCGIRVAVRPNFKAVRIEQAGAETQHAAVVTGAGLSGLGSAVTRDEERTLDSFLAMTDTKASYRINTYWWDQTIEIVDVSSQQILSVLQPNQSDPLLSPEAWFGQTGTKSSLKDLLRAIGFKVVEDKPPAPKVTKRKRRPERQSDKRVPVVSASQRFPVFTVIPASDLLRSEISFAIGVERLLIGLGLHVVRPPIPHYRETSTALTKAAANEQPRDVSSKATSARRIEAYFMYEDTLADVILETNHDGAQVKIIDKASKEVRSVVNLYAGQGDRMIELRDALRAVGIPVVYEPPKDIGG
jgi:hypothetical protein